MPVVAVFITLPLLLVSQPLQWRDSRVFTRFRYSLFHFTCGGVFVYSSFSFFILRSCAFFCYLLLSFASSLVYWLVLFVYCCALYGFFFFFLLGR